MSPFKNRDRLGLALGLIGVIIFAGTVPATRVAVSELSPWFVTFARAALAGIAAGFLLIILRRKLERKFWRDTALASLCLVIGFPGFIALAVETSSAAHAGVVLGLLPITTAVMAVLIAGEKPQPAFWFWSALGAVLVIAFTLRAGAYTFTEGDIYLLLATLCAAAGYTLAGKLSRNKPGWEVISWQLVIAYPGILAGTFFFWDETIFNAAKATYTAFFYVAFFSMFIGFFVWNAGLAIGGIARVSQVQLLQTFITLIIAAALLGEKISLETWAFAASIVLVIWLATRTRIKT